MEQKYLTVSSLNRYIKSQLEQDLSLQNILLKGEVSNFKPHSSGHFYFTLKDDNSQIRAIMFSYNARTLPFRLENGMKVLVEGELSVYEPGGSYSIRVTKMQQDGLGNLFLRFEKLKKELASEGLFDESHKKPIPKYPSKIALITANPSAAMMDVIRTIHNRFPICQVVVFPVPVQGNGAFLKIIDTLNMVDKYNFPLIILSRGGGSLEDLWNFNEEQLARTIYELNTPIISGIGHEVDFTICDFVSDKRAATPTAAGVMAVPDINELREMINNYQYNLQYFMNLKVKQSKETVYRIKEFYLFKNPNKLYESKRIQLDNISDKINNVFNNKMSNSKQEYLTIKQTIINKYDLFYLKERTHVSHLNDQLLRTFDSKIKNNDEKFKYLISRLNSLSPLKTLERGYSIVRKDKKIISSSNELKSDDEISIKMKDGEILAKVK